MFLYLYIETDSFAFFLNSSTDISDVAILVIAYTENNKKCYIVYPHFDGSYTLIIAKLIYNSNIFCHCMTLTRNTNLPGRQQHCGQNTSRDV